jgi:heavy metal translocating P-type ATPase
LTWSRDTYIALFVFVAILLHFLLRFGFYHDAPVASLPLFAALLAGVPLLFDLLRKLVRGQFGSDLIAGVSVVSAVVMHEYLVASVVILMLSGGQALENYATRKASSVLKALAQRMPTEAHLLKDSSFVNIPVSQIRVGDVLLLFPHEICPVDGEVMEGHGRMDESFLTGEPFELSKAPGTRVLSGAINGDTLLKIHALKIPQDSRYTRILKVIQQTEQNQPRIRRIGDRLGAWYTPLALGLAALGWVLSGNPERFLAVSVIATPCPLLLAIPVAILGGISLAARRGIIVRNPAVLEQIDSCRSFIFDKTGTLTYGRPALATVFCGPAYNEDEVLSFAASLENYSRHPLARGILEAARQRQVAISLPSNAVERPGDGLRGTVNGHAIHITGRKQAELRYGTLPELPAGTSGLECVIFVDGRFAAQLTFADELKGDSLPFVRHLGPKHRAQRLILLSGDKESEVKHIASQVGIDEAYFGKSPEEKLAFVQEQSRHNKTLFVGDGINDAPSMLAATVGVALGGTSDAISESADAVVLDASLAKIDELIHIGRRMKRISLESAVGGMLLSAIGMIAAATGHLSPLAGAIAQEVIDLIVVLNAIRVPFVKPGLADF